MIALISGKVIEKLPDTLIIEVNGVGYGVYVAYEDYNQLNVNDETKLYIHEHIREAAHDLYGFTNIDTRNLFNLLINVNGIGPKMALAILGLGTAEEVKFAISEGNTKLLQTAGGVGKRVAERVIVDLKDKVGIGSSDEATAFLSSKTGEKDEALQALITLGYNFKDASVALSKVDNKIPTEQRVKEALKSI